MNSGKINKFIGLSFAEKRTFAEAVFLLAFAKLIILFLPLKRIAPYLGKVNKKVRTSLSAREQSQAERMRLIMLMSSGNVPWESVCLDQALATIMMLNRRKLPYSLCFGVKKDESNKKLKAHAWVICGEAIVVGGQRSKQYMVTAIFARDFKRKEGRIS